MDPRVANEGITHTILLIDDKPEQLSALALVLGAEGYRVAFAQSGAEGLKCAAMIAPDLVLLDVRMPGIDGFETCRRLKNMEGICNVPVIFVSSEPDGKDRLEAFEVGGVDYINKPFHIDEVLARIRTQLSLYDAYQRAEEQAEQLRREALLRQQAEAKLEELRSQIEAGVALRTIELNDANARLKREVDGHRHTEKNLRQEEARLRRLFESDIIGILFWDADGNISEANERFLQMSGYTQDDLRQGKVQWGAITPPEHKSADWRALRELKRSGSFKPYEKEYIRHNGKRCPVLIGGAYVDDAKESGIAFVLDLSERKQTERALREKEARLRRLFEANLIGIVFAESETGAIDANDAFLKIVGYTRDDLAAGRIRWHDLTPPEYRDVSARGMEEFQRTGGTTYEKEYFRKDGTRVPVLIGMTRFDDVKDGGTAFVLDLTERKQAEERIRYMADHDALTRLPNRTLFRDRLQHAMTHAHRTHARVAVLFIDLDYFKNINDSLGHEIGDHLLKMVATRLRECVREDDTVARLGGDEFVLSLPLTNGAGDAALVAHKALHALDTPFQCDGHELHVGCSIGISLYPDDGADAEALMRTADTAMYHAKEKGRGNYQFFTPALNRAAQRRLALTNALRRALAHNEFELHYQPQVNLENGNIISAEALLRWHKPGMAPVTCNEFIALAEESGLILQMGDWVLQEACKQLKQWHQRGHTEMMMAVNLSPRQFHQPGLQKRIHDIIAQHELVPDMIDLEITEGILMQCSEDNVSTLQDLSDMGIKLSVDDFGTGYSSLAYLQRFPVDALKIDRSFVRGIGQDRNDTSLVSAIISMAHSLHLNVLAEGVETPEQIRFLLEKGCRSAQGYYYSQAVAAEAFTELLEH
jgi:diguanylate cyclase (GGDEF)-like protein/PAS domain S-box-containing protein